MIKVSQRFLTIPRPAGGADALTNVILRSRLTSAALARSAEIPGLNAAAIERVVAGDLPVTPSSLGFLLTAGLLRQATTANLA
jgi:hypothetical protein